LEILLRQPDDRAVSQISPLETHSILWRLFQWTIFASTWTKQIALVGTDFLAVIGDGWLTQAERRSQRDFFGFAVGLFPS
jgi:hypothetical protein